MSVLGPNVQTSPVSIPVRQYTAAVTDRFPRVGRNRLVESSVLDIERIDILPVNLTTEKQIDGDYLEFRIPGVESRFLDLSSVCIHMKLGVTKADADRPRERIPLTDTDRVTLANGTSNTIFRAIQIFVGGILVESNPFHNYSSYVKLLSTFRRENIDTMGANGFFYDKEELLVDTFTAASFSTVSPLMTSKLNQFKQGGLDLYFPLCFDLSSLDSYLLDGIDVRIRLEFASDQWVLCSDQTAANMQLHVDSARLWLDRVVPHPNALQAVNMGLQSAGSVVDCLFDRTLYKTVILPANQTSLTVEMPWGQVVPNILSLCLIDQQSYSGAITRNPLYFQHANLSECNVQINGVPVYQHRAKFPNEVSQLYYDTCATLGLSYNHMITRETFTKGRSLLVYDLDKSTVDDAISLEKSAILRISINVSNAFDQPRVLLLLGKTSGVLNVFGDRTVSCDVRA